MDKNERNYYSKRLSFIKRTSQEEIQLHEDVIREMFDEIDEEWRQAFNQNLGRLETYGSPVLEFLQFLYPARLRNLYPGTKASAEKLPPDPATTRARSRSRLWNELMDGLVAAFAENQSGTMETILDRAKSYILDLRANEPVFGY